MTGNQIRAMRDVIDGGPDGAYVGLGSFIGRESGALIEMGAAELRIVHRVGTTTRSSVDPRPCEWDDHYLVATEQGREMWARFKAAVTGRQ